MSTATTQIPLYNTQDFLLTPGELSLADISALIDNKARIYLDEKSYEKIQSSRDIVNDIIASDTTVYGINTGFGLLANKKISYDNLKELQRRIVLSHATGVGNKMDNRSVKLIMLLKINSLAQGYSGITQETLDALIALYNHGIYPLIPEKGSVGASGDLAPLAHMAMALIGEGEVFYQDQVRPAIDALAEAGLKPMILKEKEGLALLNGTQASTALAIIGLLETMKCYAIASISGSLSIDATLGSLKPFHPTIAKIKRCQGQARFSQVINTLLKDSELLASHECCCNKVQDPYSLRCQPQVMGAIWQHIESAKENLLNEANGVSDNPLIIPETKEVISGGNFHAEKVAISADMLSISLAEIGAISERRIALLIDKNLSDLPPFLVEDAGLNSGFMLAHVTASALASENKTLAHPASIDSLPTSANQEDHVSMATFAARKLGNIAENVLSILAIETLAACQGVSLRGPLKTSIYLQQKHQMIREKVPFYDQDRYFAYDIETASVIIQQATYYSDVQTQLFNL